MEMSPELNRVREKIEKIAIDSGLDFFPMMFEVVDFEQMNELAAFDGFPVRYPHWQFAMKYDRLRKSYLLGLHKIYEMVLNTNPCIAYLLQGNSITEQKLVMAHVFAHSDFFKNNIYFKNTNRKMLDRFANHASQIRRFCDRYGAESVEKFLDACLSLQNLIDPNRLFFDPDNCPDTDSPDRSLTSQNPSCPEPFLKTNNSAPKNGSQKAKLPDKPEQDVLLFLLEHAPLKSWQESILSIIREEAYYFAPQGQTKIMNEGWATYWHAKMMTCHALHDAEVIDYASSHAAAVATQSGGLNPYKLGSELFKDIEERWNTGRFGNEYTECDDLHQKTNWNRDIGMGGKKIFEVRKLHNDLSFIDTFLTEEFCQRQKLFAYEYNAIDEHFEVHNRSFSTIKNKLLQSLTNLGSPKITVVNGNYQQREELFLLHSHDGIDLKLDEARETLVNLFGIWQRKVYLETVQDECRLVLNFDGTELREERRY